MYNLFVAGNDEWWENGFAEIDKSRFLEYTSKNIADQFNNPSEKQINKLKSLPCLFAYERHNKKDGRIGYLKNIRKRDKTYLIEFEFDSNYPMINYEIIEKLAPLLDIGEWELNRTHWAIKDEDLLNRINHEFNLNISKAPVKINLSSPKSSLPKISTVKTFVEKIFNFTSEEGFEVFYRGHSNIDYKLVPSLNRVNENGEYRYLFSENIMYNEMILANPTEFSTDSYTFEKLVRMQHYSLPTRLLDITSNPLIALFFACNSNDDISGEVIIFKVKKNMVKYFDSDTASCIANLAKLTQIEKDELNFNLDIEQFNNTNVVKRLHHYISEEKPYFKEIINPNDIKKIICIKSKKSNSRIASQSGSFLLFGIDAIFSEHGTEDIKIERIEINNKKELLKDLDTLNINQSTVFPHIESSAKYIASKNENSQIKKSFT